MGVVLYVGIPLSVSESQKRVVLGYVGVIRCGGLLAWKSGEFISNVIAKDFQMSVDFLEDNWVVLVGVASN